MGMFFVAFATHALVAVGIGGVAYWWGRTDGHEKSFRAGMEAERTKGEIAEAAKSARDYGRGRMDGRADQLRESESASKALMRKTTGETLGYVVAVVEHLRDGGRIEFIEKEGD